MEEIVSVQTEDEIIAIGDVITTQKSGVIGTVTRIEHVPGRDEMYRLLLSVDGVERWTTYQMGLVEM